MNLLNVLLTTIKAKITPVWTKLKLWTSWTFIQSRVITKIRLFFTQTLTIKPRHKKDYYPIFGWLVSKKLAFAAVLVVGVASLYYLSFVNPISVFKGTGDAIRTYSYSSIPLRFTKGTVKIKAESGYIAYEGNVEKGQVTGDGTLYNADGEVLYMGTFAKNKYNGQGKEYYPGQTLKYAGGFTDNLYEGTGILYRQNGTKEYEGAFSLGMKEGEGTLFDSGGNEIYKGNFSKDQLLYSDLLGKKTSDVAEIYDGVRTIYTDDTHFAVYLEDINAIYTGTPGEENLDDSVIVEGVYVLDAAMQIKGKSCRNIAELGEMLGNPIYEGNSAVTMPEAVAINAMNEKENHLFIPVHMDTNAAFTDSIVINDFESDNLVYLYSYKYEDLVYTFFTNEKYGNFGMYLIEKDTTAGISE